MYAWTEEGIGDKVEGVPGGGSRRLLPTHSGMNAKQIRRQSMRGQEGGPKPTPPPPRCVLEGLPLFR